jgi:hypothetical protein
MEGLQIYPQSLGNRKGTHYGRRDILRMKQDLMRLVSNEDYWPTFRDFVSGRCPRATFDIVMRESLLTVQAKRLHNELIRAILQNAHFSSIPPPGVTVPSIAVPVHKGTKKCPLKSKSIDMSVFQSFTASDFGLLPGSEQLKSRVGAILKRRRIHLNVPSRTVGEVKRHLLRFILLLLSDCLDLLKKPTLKDPYRVIKLDKVMQLMTKSQKYCGTVSDEVLLCYRELC